MTHPHEEPAALAAAAERQAALPPGPGDRFAGYGVLGLAFQSGDVLALRRFPATSCGAGYTSIWHQSSDGRWTFYSDVPVTAGCVPYFAPGLTDTIVTPIRLEWRGTRRLAIAADGGRLLAWSMWFAPTAPSAAINALLGVLPEGWWRRRRLLTAAGAMAGLALGAGRLRLTGHTPSGHRFVAAPARVWTVAASRATVAGRDLGSTAPPARHTTLGDVVIPRRGLLAFGQSLMLAPGGKGVGSG
ncbi:MAG: hypothetical protein Q8L86_04265 [Vicinamibacterales bacterium]|nr:hypothetical protein [Vicinamibacterales bacterium]